MTGLLDRILAGGAEHFALVHRPETGSAGTVDVLCGTAGELASLADVELRDLPGPGHDVLVVVPYRQIRERGYAAPDDGAPLLAITVTEQDTVPLGDLVHRVADVPTSLSRGRFDVDDDAYAETVRRIVEDEIGSGEGANFVIKRTFLAEIGDYTPDSALAVFRRLLQREHGAFWTFLIHAGGRTFVGATPERHVTLNGGTVSMNPISGTYRYPPTGPTLEGVIGFLADRKETDELYMVVDEELKMMARICESGGRVMGPYLKEMAHLAHTEYFIEGQTGRDPRDILHETLFAPTVTGSPLESATKVINRYEPQGRGYYSGVAALIGRDANGEPAMDSAILIRTAEIDARGAVRIAVGATLVRHSDPASEVAETRAKAEGLRSAFTQGTARRFGNHPRVRAALRRRNSAIADYWLDGSARGDRGAADLAGLRALVVDAEDTFTAMLAHQLRSLGLSVTVRRFDEPYELTGADLVVLGPGPGDPRTGDLPKIAHLRSAVDTLLGTRQAFVAVCLSHQVLSRRLGFPLVRRAIPNQGVQREIDLFGARERVGFYNTFVAHSDSDKSEIADVGLVEVSRDPATHEVHALRGPRFASMQFHAESLLTPSGQRIIGDTIAGVFGR